MRYDRSKLKWNGWGWRDSHYDFEGGEANFWSVVQQELGIKTLAQTPAKALEDLAVPASRLSQ